MIVYINIFLEETENQMILFPIFIRKKSVNTLFFILYEKFSIFHMKNKTCTPLGKIKHVLLSDEQATKTHLWICYDRFILEKFLYLFSCKTNNDWLNLLVFIANTTCIVT